MNVKVNVAYVLEKEAGVVVYMNNRVRCSSVRTEASILSVQGHSHVQAAFSGTTPLHDQTHSYGHCLTCLHVVHH